MIKGRELYRIPYGIGRKNREKPDLS